MTTTLTTETMHEDHVRWANEHAHWNADLDSWEVELSNAMGDLARFKDALRAQHEELIRHGRAVRKQIEKTVAHEHRLTVTKRDFAEKDLNPLFAAHEDETVAEMSLAAAHENLKKRHHAMMARLAKVTKWLMEDPLES